MAGETQVPSEPAGESVKALRCPSCGAAVTLRAKGQSLAVVCASCHSILNTQTETPTVIGDQGSARNVKPPIPIGARGKLHGETFEAIGYLRRSDGSGNYRWDEVLLWNPMRGFRWLHVYNGHWTLFTMLTTKPSREYRAASYNTQRFALFEKGKARVIAVHGEFYWRVRVGDETEVEDYVAPPFILSQEREGYDEITWSLGEYVEPEEIAAAFGLTTPLPRRVGVAPNQPNPLSGIGPELMQYVAIALLVVALFHFFFSGEDRELMAARFHYQAGITPATWISPSFDVYGTHGNVGVGLATQVEFDNNWAEFEVTLVDENSGATFAGAREISHYSGRDSDGRWEEGGSRNGIVIGGVPAGRYHVEIDPILGDGLRQVDVGVRAVRGAVVWANTVLAMLAILLFPLAAGMQHSSFESQRWQSSDYTPSGGKAE